ncbi:MAG: outer membrane lipoprotein carrier protein LolA [Bacteroidetes bacterium]|nr:outer membrane lipoprotein carrier protein LolA [Bacteroidota bacterium]
MRKIALLTLLLLGCINLNAQEATLKTIGHKVASLGTFSCDVDFTTKIIDGDENTISGTMVVSGDKYVVKFKNFEVYSNGVSLWTFVPERKEVTIDNVTKEDAGLFTNPKDFLSLSSKDFEVKERLAISSLEGENENVLELNPKSELMKASVSKVFLKYNKSSLPERVIVDLLDNSIVMVVISNLEGHKIVTNQEFIFNLSRAKEVIDFRK